MVPEYVRDLMPDARAVYVSYDTTTLAHVHELWQDAPKGTVDEILRGASATLDLAAPVAVVLPSMLKMLSDDAALGLVDALRRHLAVGSYLVMAVTSVDISARGTVEVS
jgi:hypothetical protein